MSDKQNLERLKRLIDKESQAIPFTENDVQFLIRLLNGHSREHAIQAALTLTDLDEDSVFKELIDNFDSYTPTAQEALTTAFVCIDRYELYKALFEFIEKHPKTATANYIIRCLSKTHYFIFLPLMDFLAKADGLFKEHLKVLIKNLGFPYLKKYLEMFPELPNEAVFREVFGDDLINSLKKHHYF